jgi:REP element-mobilizing transposase RayT
MSNYIRKRNRLIGYDYSLNGAYFITINTINYDKILSEIKIDDKTSNPIIILTDIGKLVHNTILFYDGKKNIKIGHLCIMPNHIHFILHYLLEPGDPRYIEKTKNISVSDFVRLIKTWITKQLGHPILHRSFWDRIIRSEFDYQRIVKYIETNPARWLGDYNFQANPMIGLAPLFKEDENCTVSHPD